MMCYRDRTYCTFYASCLDGEKCGRALTPQVLTDAKEWWRGVVGDWVDESAVPVCTFVNQPDCWKDALS